MASAPISGAVEAPSTMTTAPPSVAPAQAQPPPAEHVPSPTFPGSTKGHVRIASKANGFTQAHEALKLDPRRHARGMRSKSGSLSFPVFPAPPEKDMKSITSPMKTSDGVSMGLKIIVPSTNDSSFLTALAAQERQVLELREELQKAEASLTGLKQQWVTQESKRRYNDSRKLHQMQSMGVGRQANRVTSDGALGPLYAEIERKKATLNYSKPTRRRYFSPSRHARALSLVSPDSPPRSSRNSEPVTEDTEHLSSPADDTTLAESPAELLPGPDFEKQTAMNPIAESQPSSKRTSGDLSRRRAARSSIQMTKDLREGLWTFFEDLKHATYGDDARAPAIPPPKRPLNRRDGRPHVSADDRPSSRDSSRLSKSPGGSPARRPKHVVRRQTWQIRPWVFDEALVDIGGNFWKEHGLADPTQAAEKPEDDEEEEPALANANLKRTPRRLSVVKDLHGERWETWDSPRDGGSPVRSISTASISQGRASPETSAPSSSLPTPTSSSSEMESETTPRPSIVVGGSKKNTNHRAETSNAIKEHGRRDSLPWPDLNKLRPGHLRRTASHLMDEWEKSLNPPPTQKA